MPIGMDQCCCASLQFCRDRLRLDDMFRELQPIPQYDPRRHRRSFAHKCVHQSTGWNILVRHDWEYSAGAKHVRQRCPN